MDIAATKDQIIDADTLGGLPASAYVKKAEIDEINSEINTIQESVNSIATRLDNINGEIV